MGMRGVRGGRLAVGIGFVLLGAGLITSCRTIRHSTVLTCEAERELPAALLKAYADGVRDLTIPPGTYRIPATGRCAIRLENWTNATIRADGVTLVFEELGQRPVCLSRCDRVTLEGATLRFAEPSFTQGRIKALAKDGRGDYLDWQVDAGYPVFDPAKSCFDVVDRQTRLLKEGTGDIGCKNVEPLGDGQFRLRDLHGLVGTAAVGDWLFTRRPGGGGPIIQLDGSARCTMRRVTLENSGFAAFFETGGEGGHVYLACRVKPGPKPAGAAEEQLVGCGADGFHSTGTRNGPTFEKCRWEGVLHDDCIAIHGSLQKVVRANGATLVLEKGDRGGFVAGEPVRVSSAAGFYGEFTCTALRVLEDEGGLLELTLDRASGAPSEARASNPRHNGAGFRIRNCTLGNCRSRGILVKADDGVIEGCTISGCGMSAISVGPEYWWGEADYSRRVAIRGNVLRNNVLNGSGAGVVFVHGDGAMGNGDIAVLGNLFDRNYGEVAVYAEDTDGLRVEGNRFVMPAQPVPGKARTVVSLKASRNVALAENAAAGLSRGDALLRVERVQSLSGGDGTGLSGSFR